VTSRLFFFLRREPPARCSCGCLRIRTRRGMQYARCWWRWLCGVLRVGWFVLACLRLLTPSLSLSLEPWKRTLQISTSRRRRRWCATSRLLGGGLVRAFTRFVLACLVVISLELAQQGTDGGLPGCCVGGDRLGGSLGHIWESDTCGMQ
jgi:hypothetical protein